MKYLLGIDFGGGASKATLIDTEGNLVAENTVEYPTLYPQPYACEQNPEDWISALCENTKAIILKSGIKAEDILALSIDSATHTFLVCDGDFKPLRNAIHWTDARSRKQADALREKMGEEIFKKTYHKPDTIWTLPQLIWLKENEPDVFKRVRYLFFEKDYVRYYLTGVYCTDYIEAEGSMLFDFDKQAWDEKLLSLAGLSIKSMPRIVSPLDYVGTVSESASRDSGLSTGTRVICGATDTVMEVFAAGGVNSGDMTLKLATAGRICVVSDRYFADKNIINYSHMKDGLYYPGSATKSCASSLRWFRDTFGGSFEEFSSMAENIPPCSEGLIFHPYLVGELTPYANPALRGSFIGISASHTKAHFARAVMEGVAMSLLDSKTYLEAHGVKPGDSAYVIGGGAKSKVWRSIVADALNLTLISTENNDSSFGSAMCAGIYAGIFADYDDAVKKCQRIVGVTKPNPENTKKYLQLYDKYKKTSCFLNEMFHEK